ncbi:imelysin family protein [Devosia sp. 2618]|uniref:imelysin family protein n=1 Tax=Devosia sp. 2618 TaxID=3156454 RepID=UPI00339B8C07
MRLLLVTLLALLTGPAMGQETITAREILQSAVNEVIRPAMLEFKGKADGLSIAMNALCTVPSAGTVAIAKGQFRQAVQAYGRIEFIRIGPLMEDNRSDRLLFWPDRRGIGLRQVQAILADDDLSATQVTSLRGKSVATQGFGALEFVLFGTDAEVLATRDGQFRCQYGRAIASNVSQIAGELATGWFAQGGIADHLKTPAPEYADYRTTIEAMEQLVGLVSHGIEATRDTRINAFIAKGEAAAKPKQAIFWRSGLTMTMVRANIEGMQRLMAISGLARAVPAKDVGLNDSIAFEFRNAYRALDIVTLPVEAAVEDKKQAFALGYLVLVTQSLQSIVGEQLSTAMGLSVGFSSLDGD